MNPDQLKNLADTQFERSAYTKTLIESTRARLTLAHNGGLFNVGMVLIAFLDAMPDAELVIEDIYSNPIRVRRQELLDQARHLYKEVMSEWNTEFEKSNRIRRGENV